MFYMNVSFLNYHTRFFDATLLEARIEIPIQQSEGRIVESDWVRHDSL